MLFVYTVNMFKKYYSYTQEDIDYYFKGKFEDRHRYREEWFNEWKELGHCVDTKTVNTYTLRRFIRENEIPYSDYVIFHHEICFRHGVDAVALKILASADSDK